MRKIISPVVDAARVKHPLYQTKGTGNEGFFVFPLRRLNVLASNGSGWDHVSISRFDKTAPTWEEMCWVKDLFFEETEWVLQYHPAKEDYIDYGRNVLHLWKPQGIEIPKPPKEFV